MRACVCVLINWLPSLVSAPFIILPYTLHVCVLADGYSTISANEKFQRTISLYRFHLSSDFHGWLLSFFSWNHLFAINLADGKGWRYKLKFIMNKEKKNPGDECIFKNYPSRIFTISKSNFIKIKWFNPKKK